ncbi:hypothetical protein B296_00035280 [Ensete ventricosum]|uniref:Uncharacterized protein n=1 Tax=Ensete ventricosum TaxID=4639 RepID=A0A426YVP3_ENSVE|nr:hypothetical protein B296_00035280 [Ensete ventricosum]
MKRRHRVRLEGNNSCGKGREEGTKMRQRLLLLRALLGGDTSSIGSSRGGFGRKMAAREGQRHRLRWRHRGRIATVAMSNNWCGEVGMKHGMKKAAIAIVEERSLSKGK